MSMDLFIAGLIILSFVAFFAIIHNDPWWAGRKPKSADAKTSKVDTTHRRDEAGGRERTDPSASEMESDEPAYLVRCAKWLATPVLALTVRGPGT